MFGGLFSSSSSKPEMVSVPFFGQQTNQPPPPLFSAEIPK
jgi:hypothetical protein